MPIYISQALYTSGALTSGDFNPNNPVIGYKNLITYSGVSADSEVTGFPASNVSNNSTNEYWKSDNDGEQHIEFNFASATYDYVSIIGHNLKGMTYRWQYKIGVGGSWTDLTSDKIAPDNSVLMDLIESNVSDYTRIKINAPVGLKPQISVVYIGEKLRLQRRIYVGHSPLIYARRVRSQNQFSENSQYLGRVVTNRRLESSFEQQHITPEYYRSFIDPWVQHATENPWVFAWRPETYPNEVGFCIATSDIIPSNQMSNGMMQFSCNFRALYPWG